MARALPLATKTEENNNMASPAKKDNEYDHDDDNDDDDSNGPKHPDSRSSPAVENKEEKTSEAAKAPGKSNIESNGAKKTTSAKRKTFTTTTPDAKDILMGRGRLYQNQPGNITMRRLVEKNRDRYNQSHRDLRGSIAMEILNELLGSGARFLKRKVGSHCISNSATNDDSSPDEKIAVWEEASRGEAYDKLCHALRARKKALAPPKKAPQQSHMDTASMPRGDFFPNEQMLNLLSQNQRIPAVPIHSGGNIPSLGLSPWSQLGLSPLGPSTAIGPLSSRFPSAIGASAMNNMLGTNPFGTGPSSQITSLEHLRAIDPSVIQQRRNLLLLQQQQQPLLSQASLNPSRIDSADMRMLNRPSLRVPPPAEEDPAVLNALADFLRRQHG